MIIFLYGRDTYRSRQKLNEIIEHYEKIHQGGLSLSYFREENLDFQNFKNEVETVSMFKGKKLIILEDIFSNQEFQEEFLKQKEKFIKSDDIILIYETGAIVATNPLFKLLKRNSKPQEFELLKEDKLKIWVKKQFQNCNAKINDDVLAKLIQFVGNDLWQMDNEIKKLVNYRAPWRRGEDGKENEALSGQKSRTIIEEKDIELLVKPKIEIEIFKTIDAISENKKNLALHLIHKHLEKGDAPLYLLSMINFQFRNLLEIKDLVEKNIPYFYILKKSNLHPFVIKKSYQQAQKFTLAQLKKIYQKIFEVDLNIKTGKIEPETALDLFIAAI